MSRLTPAVAYYRMSSDRQETSIADQRAAVESHAEANGYKIIREYRDEGISGWKATERKAFQRLIEDSQERCDFQAVLCWDQDRFSRFPVLEANHYWYLLDSVGVHISTVAQGRLNFEDLGEWLKASVVQHGKAEYARDLARNTSRGLRKRKLAGQWVGGAPYGYRLEGGKLHLGDPFEISVVQRIFAMRCDGYGYKTIANRLNQDGVITPRNRSWSDQSVKHILQRDAYIGHTVIGKKSRAKFERLTDGIVTIENTHPAIIDRETWDKVRAIKTWNNRAHSRGKSEGAKLAGLLVCNQCGGRMYANGSGRWLYYTCSSYLMHGRCGCKTILRDKLEGAVFHALREKVLMGSMDRLQAAVQRELDRRAKPKSSNDAAKRELAKLDRQIDRAADRLLAVDDELVPDLQERLKALKQRRYLLAESIAGEAPTHRPVTAKAIAAKVWELDQILREASPTVVRNALQQIVEEIRLDFRLRKKTAKRTSYEFIGATMQLHSSEGRQQRGTWWRSGHG